MDSAPNKESHGHQSVLTLWSSKNDGKPARLPDGASEEEHAAWEKAMTDWALQGAADFARYHTLKAKDDSLMKERLNIGRDNAKIRKNILIQNDDQTRARLEVDRLLIQIQTSKSSCESMERDSRRLIARRMILDMERRAKKKETDAHKDASLLQQRIDIGRDNAKIRKNIMSEQDHQTRYRLEVDRLLLQIKVSESLCASMEKDSGRLIARRITLDKERRAIKREMDECKID